MDGLKMKPRIVLAVGLLALSGCALQTKVANDVAGDSAGAVALATGIGDTSVIPCYQDIHGVAAAIAQVNPPPAASVGVGMSLGSVQIGAGSTKKLSILTEIEVGRAIGRIQQDPACAQIFLAVGNAILKTELSAVPGGGLLGALFPQ
jgi:hypothetical protein